MTEIYNTATALLDVSPAPQMTAPETQQLSQQKTIWTAQRTLSLGWYVGRFSGEDHRFGETGTRRGATSPETTLRLFILLLGFIFHHLRSGRVYLANEKHTNTRVLGAADAAAPSSSQLVKAAGDK